MSSSESEARTLQAQAHARGVGQLPETKSLKKRAWNLKGGDQESGSPTLPTWYIMEC